MTMPDHKNAGAESHVPEPGLDENRQSLRTFRSFRETQRTQRIARGLLALFFVAMALYTVRGFLPSLIWGGIFAIASWPLYVRARTRWHAATHQLLLPAAFTLGIALIFLVPVTLFGLEAARDAEGVLHLLNNARQSGMPVPQWIDHLPLGAQTLRAWWESHLQNPDDFSALLGSLRIGQSVKMTQQVGSQLAHRGILFIFSILTLFFLLKDGDSVIRQCLVVSRRAFGKRGERIALQIIASIHGTVAGLVLVGMGEGVVMGVAYLIAGAPHAFLFGVVTAVAAMIPFCAMIAIGIVATLLLIKGSAVIAIVIMLVGLAVIFLADHLVRPALIGGSTQLPFLWVLTGILGGAESWNLLGLFMGPAIMAVLHMLWRNWTRVRD
ncbi:AI-2E family transporter [Gluconacetobacter entanii]|uniref:AI-2E family transporter n=1 Tax=Gluconacetobacter entanii TaxID=108528 RepID=A0ABT3K710_9PROT|nr:AI-2E family transporter [Gluconacetobacter entanii]MBE7618756.1 AI-2E family transporter [Komagataeibacter sp. FXV2]MCE2577226.1 AI-2E family transporter [Komagataeibacter sp. FNDCR1]MCW4591158.1 AI-2E family transporter [Gluconacetobacter entanii]MCW4594595.1 AI-2E family transporter [Gluconacetobacter entanii]NPC87830.1 AI-2E family transporter [Gluconacetobacter entanii]